MKPRTISTELNEQIEQRIIDYVDRNPHRAIPNARIARYFGVPAHRVHQTNRVLVREGRILKPTVGTYVLPDDPPQQKIEVAGLTFSPPPQTSILTSLSLQVKDLAKDYAWETGGSNDLRSFVDWVGKR